MKKSKRTKSKSKVKGAPSRPLPGAAQERWESPGTVWGSSVSKSFPDVVEALRTRPSAAAKAARVNGTSPHQRNKAGERDAGEALQQQRELNDMKLHNVLLAPPRVKTSWRGVVSKGGSTWEEGGGTAPPGPRSRKLSPKSREFEARRALRSEARPVAPYSATLLPRDVELDHAQQLSILADAGSGASQRLLSQAASFDALPPQASASSAVATSPRNQHASASARTATWTRGGLTSKVPHPPRWIANRVDSQWITDVDSRWMGRTKKKALPVSTGRATKAKERTVASRPSAAPVVDSRREQRARVARSFYRELLANGKRPLSRAKLMFVGSGYAGKTSLINRLVRYVPVRTPPRASMDRVPAASSVPPPHALSLYRR